MVHAQTAKPPARAGQFCYVHRVDRNAGGNYTLVADFAELLEGDAAERAATEDSAGFSPADLSGIYIRNRTHRLRSLPIAPYAQVYLLQEGTPTLIRLPLFERLLRGDMAGATGYWGFPYECAGEEAACLPCRIVVRGGQVVRLEQEYFP